MTRHTYVSDDLARIEFAKRAARSFKANPKFWSYTDGDIAPGELLALRWGLGDDCVKVIRIGDDEPVIFGQLIRDVEVEA